MELITEIKCPKCGCTDVTKFRYLEDIVCHRDVQKLEEGILFVEGMYESGEGYDEGTNPRLECHNDTADGYECLQEFTPDQWPPFEFVC